MAKKRPGLDAMREALSRLTARESKVPTEWEQRILNNTTSTPVNEEQVHRLHGNNRLTMSERQGVSRRIKTNQQMAREARGATEWWHLIDPNGQMSKDAVDAIKYDKDSPDPGGNRMRYYQDVMGLPPGVYPEPKDDPYNRLQAASEYIFTPKDQRYVRYTKDGRKYYRGGDFWADNLFRQVLAEDYDLDIMGEDYDYFDWEDYREKYNALQG